MASNEGAQPQQTCGLCEKNCPVEALGCGRGERAFGAQAGEGRAAGGEHRGEHGRGGRPRGGEPAEGAVQLEGLAGKLAEAGRVAQIKGAHITAAGKSADAMFGVLGDEDAAQLEALLDKLLAAWRQAHAAHHAKR